MHKIGLRSINIYYIYISLPVLCLRRDGAEILPRSLIPPARTQLVLQHVLVPLPHAQALVALLPPVEDNKGAVGMGPVAQALRPEVLCGEQEGLSQTALETWTKD